MEKVVTAAEAWMRLDELIREVVESDRPVIVQYDGEEQVVILSARRYREMAARSGVLGWREPLARTKERVEQELEGCDLPDPADVIRQGREERDSDLLSLR